MNRSVLALAFAATVLPAAALHAHDGRGQGGHRYHTTDNGIRYWHGRDGRTYCRKPNGTTGLLIGGAAGALLGRAIDTRGERATGTIVGAAAGALIGREVDRDSARCR